MDREISGIGSGISGLSISQMLSKKNNVTIYEKGDKIGGLIKCDIIDNVLFHKVGGHVFNSKNTEVLNWFNRGYAIAHGIFVNGAFYRDSKDGVLNTQNYAEFKWSQGHATNSIKWTERGENLERTEEYILDSYFGKQSTGDYNSTYKCNFEEVLEDIAMPTKYIIFK